MVVIIVFLFYGCNNFMVSPGTSKQVRPITNVRCDNVGHFPIFSEKIGRCKEEKCTDFSCK